METVAICGGSGFVGRHLLDELCKNERFSKIKVLDRRPIQNDNAKVEFHQLELTNDSQLRSILSDVNTVIHLAKSPIPLRTQTDEERKCMWRDNLEASECVVDVCISCGVSRLIYIGDAFSSLPIADNYGISEDTHSGLPSTFLLGEFGESRCRAELYARNATRRARLPSLFLRPTWVYGRECDRFWRQIIQMAEDGQIPYIYGDRRALHQFVHVENLVGLIGHAIHLLHDNPKELANQFVYVFDNAEAVSFTKTIERFVGSEKYSEEKEISFERAAVEWLWSEGKRLIGMSQPGEEQLPLSLFRFIFEKTIGFSPKKLSLLLGYKGKISQEEGMQKTAEFLRKHKNL